MKELTLSTLTLLVVMILAWGIWLERVMPANTPQQQVILLTVPLRFTSPDGTSIEVADGKLIPLPAVADEPTTFVPKCNKGRIKK